MTSPTRWALFFAAATLAMSVANRPATSPRAARAALAQRERALAAVADGVQEVAEQEPACVLRHTDAELARMRAELEAERAALVEQVRRQDSLQLR